MLKTAQPDLNRTELPAQAIAGKRLQMRWCLKFRIWLQQTPWFGKLAAGLWAAYWQGTVARLSSRAIWMTSCLAFKIYRKNRFSHHETFPTTGARLAKRKACSGCPSQSHSYFHTLHYKRIPGLTVLPQRFSL